jgi:hypothetical protein
VRISPGGTRDGRLIRRLGPGQEVTEVTLSRACRACRRRMRTARAPVDRRGDPGRQTDGRQPRPAPGQWPLVSLEPVARRTGRANVGQAVRAAPRQWLDVVALQPLASAAQPAAREHREASRPLLGREHDDGLGAALSHLVVDVAPPIVVLPRTAGCGARSYLLRGPVGPPRAVVRSMAVLAAGPPRHALRPTLDTIGRAWSRRPWCVVATPRGVAVVPADGALREPSLAAAGYATGHGSSIISS